MYIKHILYNMYTISFIHSSVDRHLGGFHVLAVAFLYVNLIGIQLIYNVGLVSGAHQRDSVTHIHVFILL